ncbi:MAG: hypothetical protein A2Z81_03155 [Omnitrophica WOR_2 bacterium GWA2_45_18]|nr:MAG: hypothetical protein A2Z81_03155 [Omnitrophica WOR_2 bacterium GWA2_45_18]
MSIEGRGSKCHCSSDTEDKMSRRDFLNLSALWTCVGAWVLTTMGLLKFPKPALLPDPSRTFKIGKPEDFPVGTSKILDDKKVLITRDAQGISAVSLVCTHLGCIVQKEVNGFSCPCHGSKFDAQGDVIGGPAPRGLSWLEVSQVPGGKLVVNAAKRVAVGTKFTV